MFFLDLPPEVGSGHPGMAPPLGSQEEVRRKLAACFSGIVFDEAGAAVVRRPGYTLTLQVEDADPAGFVSVRLRGGGAGLVALRRLSQQTGWRPYDAESRQPFDLTGAAPEGGTRDRPAAAEEAPWGAAARGLGIAAALALAAALGPRLGATTSAGSEAAVLRDLKELEAAATVFGGLNSGCHVGPEILAVPGRYPAVMAQGMPSGRLLHERFLSAVRHRYRFEFQASKPCQSPFAVVKPSFQTFVMAAIPEPDAPAQLRSFAYHSYRSGGVFARQDRQVPSLDDTWVPFR